MPTCNICEHEDYEQGMYIDSEGNYLCYDCHNLMDYYNSLGVEAVIRECYAREKELNYYIKNLNEKIRELKNDKN